MDRLNINEDTTLNDFRQWCEEVEEILKESLTKQTGFKDYANKVMEQYYNNGWEPTPMVAATIEYGWLLKQQEEAEWEKIKAQDRAKYILEQRKENGFINT